MPYGPDNPHPLSHLKTELVWQGKYDASGHRIAPLRLKLPFQTVETVNEDPKTRQLALDMFNAGRLPEWRNRLIWGDKKYVLATLGSASKRASFPDLSDCTAIARLPSTPTSSPSTTPTA